MTETTRFQSNTTAICVIALAIAILFLAGAMANDRHKNEVTRSCMDSVVTPDPEAIDYDTQSLEFAVQIRRCMRA